MNFKKLKHPDLKSKARNESHINFKNERESYVMRNNKWQSQDSRLGKNCYEKFPGLNSN